MTEGLEGEQMLLEVVRVEVDELEALVATIFIIQQVAAHMSTQTQGMSLKKSNQDLISQKEKCVSHSRYKLKSRDSLMINS